MLSFNFRAPEDEIWKHVDFILRQDQLEGVKVFIKRQECEEQKKLLVDVGKCENVLNFLQQFPIAKMTYLEFLVKQKKLQVSFKLLINFPHTSEVKFLYLYIYYAHRKLLHFVNKHNALKIKDIVKYQSE